MNAIQVAISAVTAFIISAGGAVAVVAISGNLVTLRVIYAATCVGLVTAAKDTRSLLKLPPVSAPSLSTGNTDQLTRTASTQTLPKL